MLDIKLPSDYKPSDGEINNFVYLCCKYTCGWIMRSTDLAMCKMLAGEIVGLEGLNKLLEVTCEYVWDHICGEPDEPNAESFQEHMKGVLETWYSNTTPEMRSNTK